MQTDRELLELSTRALNGKLLDTLPGYPAWAEFEGHPMGPWDPLADDGDALRLAVKLGIKMIPEVGGRALVVYRQDGSCFEIGNSSRAWPVENMRRAIVRAAAAIGETL